MVDRRKIPVTGLILAGGAGRRMGGIDKGLLEHDGQPLIAHAIRRFSPQVDSLLICANRNRDAYVALGYPVISDVLADFQGPLAGLQAGLAACVTPWLVTCPCDCPTLPQDLVARLLETAEKHRAKTAVASTREGIQPTFQLCHRDMLPELEAFLASGKRRVGSWCRETLAVEAVFPDTAMFVNLNTPAELSVSLPNAAASG